MKHATLAILAALFACVTANAQEGTKVAVVSPGRAFQEMQETKDLKQKMESDRQAIQAEGKRRQDEVEEAKKKRTLFNEGTEDFNKANKDLIEKAIGLQTWQEGQAVELDIQPGRKGRQAANLRLRQARASG